MDHPAASPKVLVAPLDWGLGHATRCIPIIRELLAQNCTVVLAGEGKIKVLLQLEFPDLQFVNLRGYRVEYAASGWGLAAKIVAQIPKIISAIKRENQWLKTIVIEEEIDAVIADNRYGFSTTNVHSVLITHQLNIKAPFRLAEEVLRRINYKFINKFDECWVPDHSGPDNLAGFLSHPNKMPENSTKYLGPRFRFQQKQSASGDGYLLILLSGPEPQRTVLETLLLEDLKNYGGEVVLVRGLPGGSNDLETAGNISVYAHLPAADLEAKLRSASLVISRCGYSTVMDLAALNKKSILIPTPGQTEQQYLAKHLMQKRFALCVAQEKFRLANVLELAHSFSYQPFYLNSAGLQTTIKSFVETVQLKKGHNF